MTTTTKHSVSEERVVLPVDLRDYFAAKALAGWWSSSDTMCALPKDKTLVEFQTEACAKFYEWADAMLAERAKDSP